MVSGTRACQWSIWSRSGPSETRGEEANMNCPRCGNDLRANPVGRSCVPCEIVLPPTSTVAGQLFKLAAESADQYRLLDSSVRDLASAGEWDELEALLLAP